MIRAIAVDDEPLALKVLSHHCEKVPYMRLEKTFTNQQEAIHYLENYPVDLIFLDIEMPQSNGIDFYKALELKTMVIFTTAYDHYAIEGFNVNAVDYILKPIGFDRFKTATDKALALWKQTQESMDLAYLLIRADYKLHKIDFNEILYIEGLDDYVQIHLESKPKIVTRMYMKAMMEKLPLSHFLRIHRSFILPIHRITSFQNKIIEIGDLSFPIGDTYKTEVLTKLSV